MYKQWIKVCPYPGKHDIRPPPPPIKHMSHVKNMARDRQSISYSGLKPSGSK